MTKVIDSMPLCVVWYVSARPKLYILNFRLFQPNILYYDIVCLHFMPILCKVSLVRGKYLEKYYRWSSESEVKSTKFLASFFQFILIEWKRNLSEAIQLYSNRFE